MAEILLSSEAFIKSVTNISDNVSGKYILTSLREAQDVGLRNILGDNLLEKLKALVKFMINSCKTTIHSKKLYLLQHEIALAGTREKSEEIIKKIEALLLEDRENVLDTIPAVQTDSRLGWEASMEYQADEECLKWKLRQLDYELNFTLPKFRKSNSL